MARFILGSILFLGLTCELSAAEIPESMRWTPARQLRILQLYYRWSDFVFGDEDVARARLDDSLFRIETAVDPAIRQEEALSFRDDVFRLADSEQRQRFLDSLDREREEPVRRAILNAMILGESGVRGESDVQLLIRRLRDPSERIRMLAVIALNGAEDDDGKTLGAEHPFVQKQMKDAAPDVRALLALAFDVETPDRLRALPQIRRAIQQEDSDPVPILGSLNAGETPAWGFDLRSSLYSLAGSLGAPAADFAPVVLQRLESGGPGFGKNGETPWKPNPKLVMGCLLGIGEPAVPHLVKSLSSADPETKQLAAIVLGWMKKEPEKGIPALVESLQSEYCPGYCAYVFMRYDESAIANYGAAAVPAVIKMIAAKPDSRAATRVLALFDHEDRDVSRAIIGQAKDRDPARRRVAIEALSFRSAHADEIGPTLAEAEKDADPTVAETASKARQELAKQVQESEKRNRK